MLYHTKHTVLYQNTIYVALLFGLFALLIKIKESLYITSLTREISHLERDGIVIKRLESIFFGFFLKNANSSFQP